MSNHEALIIALTRIETWKSGGAFDYQTVMETLETLVKIELARTAWESRGQVNLPPDRRVD